MWKGSRFLFQAKLLAKAVTKPGKDAFQAQKNALNIPNLDVVRDFYNHLKLRSTMIIYRYRSRLLQLCLSIIICNTSIFVIFLISFDHVSCH